MNKIECNYCGAYTYTFQECEYCGVINEYNKLSRLKSRFLFLIDKNKNPTLPIGCLNYNPNYKKHIPFKFDNWHLN